MTISSATRKAGPFAGNGVTTGFPFAFKVFSSGELQVVRADDVTGIETTLTLTTDYTASLNADQDANPGGTVTLVAAPLAAGTTLVITSSVSNTQSTALTNGGGFYPTVIEDALDRATIQIQQLSEQVDRSVKVPITSSTDPDDLVATVVASAASSAASAAAAAASAAAAEAAIPSGALGFTPVNTAGDTMFGSLSLPSITIGAGQTLTGITSIGKSLAQTASQAAARTTLDAAQKTSSVSAVTPAVDDYIGGTDTSNSSAEAKFTVANVLALAASPIKAWINFDGTSGSIGTGRASFNVASVTDNGTGNYTINFTNAMPDTNYAVVGTAQYDPSSADTVTTMVAVRNSGTPILTTSVSIAVVGNLSATLFDAKVVNVIVVR